MPVNARRRVPYFERPAPPHDWRWNVSIIGRSLITLGLLMFAFVAYQLWGTGIQTARAQADLTSKFQQQLQSTSTSGSTTTSTSTSITAEPSDTTIEVSTTSSTIPVAPPNALAEGEPVAILRIPSIDLTKTVVEGVGVNDLKQGPGHFAETPLPGQLGNAAIAGHRTTYGEPFRNLDQVRIGDTIQVDTLAGTFTYAVTNMLVVNPSEYGSVIPTKDPTKATLTLATCTPVYTSRQRLIVQADLVVDQSAPVMRPSSATVPDPTATTMPSTLPGDTDNTATDATDVTDATTDTDTTDTGTTDTATTAPGATAPVGAEVSDTFSQGWFSDSGAIPWVIVYGLLLAAVAIGAYQVGRRSGRLWVAFVVGFVPFVVVLYFFFENVNRLLPPGL